MISDDTDDTKMQAHAREFWASVGEGDRALVDGSAEFGIDVEPVLANHQSARSASASVTAAHRANSASFTPAPRKWCQRLRSVAAEVLAADDYEADGCATHRLWQWGQM